MPLHSQVGTIQFLNLQHDLPRTHRFGLLPLVEPTTRCPPLSRQCWQYLVRQCDAIKCHQRSSHGRHVLDPFSGIRPQIRRQFAFRLFQVMKPASQLVIDNQQIFYKKIGRQEEVRIRIEFFCEIGLPAAIVAIDVQGALAADPAPPPVQEHGTLPRIGRGGRQPSDLQIAIARSHGIGAGDVSFERAQFSPVVVWIPIVFVEVDEPADRSSRGTAPSRASLDFLVVFVDVARQ
mmetsp:Transcript_25855/g.54644  ORF Transcript_25855/g.54644 Transcript_25855/m.54644 type:complete len:234 (-) Transcript_25855:142-843(-)